VRRFFSAVDIRRFAEEKSHQYLLLAPGDIITPEALDIAREVGIQIHWEGDAPYRDSLPPLLNKYTAPGKPIILLKANSVNLKPFTYDVGHPEMNIQLCDVITAADGSPMAAGFMTWSKGSFPWTLNYDEIDLVIDGQLEIKTKNQDIIGNQGDVIYIPKGSSIFFGSPSYAKTFYVTFPAEWGS